MTKASAAYITKLLDLNKAQEKLFEQYLYTLEDATGKMNVVDRWVAVTQKIWKSGLEHIGVAQGASFEDILTALDKEMAYLNMELLHFFHFPDLATEEGWRSVMDKFLESLQDEDRAGFFLKYEIAENLLRDHPPIEIIDYFGYADVEELLDKEDIREVYSALRFGVSKEWNDSFLDLYERLTPDDFEERDLEFVLMPSDKWFALAADFAKAKLHPFSHLKEMGIVFVVPDPKGVEERDVMKILITLVLHYIFEVGFYARYFKSLSKRHSLKFGEIVRSIIIGGILTDNVPEGSVRITHQYYTKKKNPDPRVFEPHVMPEPIHWHKGRRLLKEVLCGELDADHCVIDLWNMTFNVGQHVDGKMLSLNFADNVVGNAKHKTYHLYEDIWNSIFNAFFSEKELETALLNRLEEGYIDLYHIDSD